MKHTTPPTLHPDNSKPKTNITKEVVNWLSLPDSQKPQAFDDLLESLPKAKVISELAKLKFYQPDEVAPFLETCQSLQYDKREVKTIATYYTRLTNGGCERVMALLCHLWIKMGYRVVVVTDLPPTDEDYVIPEEVVRVILPDQFQFEEATYFPRASAWQTIIKEHHIDAVIYHSWFISHLLWDAMVIKASGASFIVHTHGIFSFFLTLNHEHCLPFAKSFSIADAVITLSDSNKAFWQHFNSNVFCTLNPFSENISDWKCQHSPEQQNLLWVGRISEEKQPYDLLDIMELVIKQVPSVKLHIVGKANTKDEEAAFSSAILNKSLQNHIILHGYQTDVRPFFEDANIFLFTSKFEGYPLALQESKMAGIPCVMYELPYLILTEGNRGMIPVRQRDTVAAANAIISLLQDTEMQLKLGKDAREHAEELFQFDFSSKWHDIFSSLTQSHQMQYSNADQVMMQTLLLHHDFGAKHAQTQNPSIQLLLSMRQSKLVRIAFLISKGFSSLKKNGIGVTTKKAIKKTIKILKKHGRL